MKAIFVKKAYDNIQPSTNIIIYMFPDKFTLRVYNYLVYNQKISGLLVVNYIFGLLNYYILLDNLKFINLIIFQKSFPKFLLHKYKSRSNVDYFV